jgi:hypothetical protein
MDEASDDERRAEPPGGESTVDALDPVEIDVERIQEEEFAATRKLSSIEAGRRIGGVAGAAMAGAMLAIQEIYEGRPHDADIVAVSESPDKVGDIDEDGIDVSVGDVNVWAPPPPGPTGNPDAGESA